MERILLWRLTYIAKDTTASTGNYENVPTTLETIIAIGKLKNNKAPEEDTNILHNY